ncbi:NAD-dependent protein deacetylase [Nakamurella deserti]|uniref:NAD-dependent protein deacetylase n=1 Tax=Nakamurella deserti TaxID=2164074 RepID=UPI000DBE3E4C|nr:NAD-dependent protein deacetylase [Nakamurella deserti]
MQTATSATPEALLCAVAEVLAGGGVAVLTGAGLSTDSGIPDYRGPGSPPRAPMTFQEFITPRGRQRYWARSFVGFERMAGAAPNPGHRALAAIEKAGLSDGLITQNVDGLHQAAGSRAVIDLHGRIDRVVCLACSRRSSRQDYQQLLAALNPDATRAGEIDLAPDGDAHVEDTDHFVVADCEHCGGVLKPDVVFFGESVPPPVVAEATALVAGARSLLVLGSSLTVYSGRRFVRQASLRGIPIVAVNRGPTRADEYATVRVDAGTSEVLPAVVDLLAPDGSAVAVG